MTSTPKTHLKKCKVRNRPLKAKYFQASELATCQTTMKKDRQDSHSKVLQISTIVLEEIIVHVSTKEMENFNDLVDNLQEKYSDKGGVKVIPPCDWIGQVPYEKWSHKLKGIKVIPKIQCTWPVADGIFRLPNNPKKHKSIGVRKN